VSGIKAATIKALYTGRILHLIVLSTFFSFAHVSSHRTHLTTSPTPLEELEAKEAVEARLREQAETEAREADEDEG
jgi:hypothetical protein